MELQGLRWAARALRVPSYSCFLPEPLPFLMAQGGLSQWLQRLWLQLGKMEPQQMEGEKCHQTHGPDQLSCPTTLPLAPSRRREGPCGCWDLGTWWFVGAGMKAGDSLLPVLPRQVEHPQCRMVVMFQGDAGPRWSRGFPNTPFRGAGDFSLCGERVAPSWGVAKGEGHPLLPAPSSAGSAPSPA